MQTQNRLIWEDEDGEVDFDEDRMMEMVLYGYSKPVSVPIYQRMNRHGYCS